MKKCSVENCNNKHYGHGYCEKHLAQIKRCGKILDRTQRDKNEIIIYETHAEMVLYNIKNQEVARTIIDLDDVDKVKKYKWGLDHNYVISHKTKQHDKLYLHRFIMECPQNMVVDHINHNTFDNRKDNLRMATSQQNNMNRGLIPTNTSGYTGVHIQNNKWRAYITVNKKQIHLGYFNTKEEAIKARQEAEIKYFGEYRYKYE